jgi:hypothetical protein
VLITLSLLVVVLEVEAMTAVAAAAQEDFALVLA